MLETSKSAHFVHSEFGEKWTKIQQHSHDEDVCNQNDSQHHQHTPASPLDHRVLLDGAEQTGSEESREETGGAHQTDEASGAL